MDIPSYVPIVLVVVAIAIALVAMANGGARKAIIAFFAFTVIVISKWLYETGKRDGLKQIARKDDAFKAAYESKKNEANRASVSDIDKSNAKWLRKSDDK